MPRTLGPRTALVFGPSGRVLPDDQKGTKSHRGTRLKHRRPGAQRCGNFSAGSCLREASSRPPRGEWRSLGGRFPHVNGRAGPGESRFRAPPARSGAPRIREQLAWRARGPGIYTMNPDGTDLTQILLTNEPDPDLSWRPRCNIRGTRGGDTLSGTIARELICGYAGNDIVYASRPMTPSSPVRAMIGSTA